MKSVVPIYAAVAGMILILAFQLGFTAQRNSATWDEGSHMYAGYLSWKQADFGINPEHPPLVKLLGTLPLLGMELETPQALNRYFKIEAFLNGKDFLFKNNANLILFSARCTAALLTLFLALLVFLAASEMFGTVAGFIALGLLIFDPNLLAHGAVLCTDMGVTCFIFATIYAYYRYVKAPSLGRISAVGIMAGLALATKHSAVLLIPMLVLLGIYALIQSQRPMPDETVQRLKINALQLTTALVAVGVIAMTLLWATYGFRFAARPPGSELVPPLGEFLSGLAHPRDIKLLSLLANWHILPESYLYGLADIRLLSNLQPSYLFGTNYPNGVLSYFPLLFLIKSTLPLLLLILITVWVVSTRRLDAWPELSFLSLPVMLYLLFAIFSKINIGVRHILPIYPFIWVLVAGAASACVKRDRRWGYLFAALLLFQAVSSIRTFPAYVAYANELAGGPAHTYQYLSDSNVDWGQQLKSVNRYLRTNNVRDCWFVYFAEGVVDTHYYGIPCRPLPTVDTLWLNEELDVPPEIEGTVLISASDLSALEFGPGKLNPYEQFKRLEPVAVIDHGVFVFKGHFKIPLAAALEHMRKAEVLLFRQKPEEAFAQASRAVALAPEAVGANNVLGDVMMQLKRPRDAARCYEQALFMAKSIEPAFQAGWVQQLSQKLSQ